MSELTLFTRLIQPVDDVVLIGAVLIGLRASLARLGVRHGTSRAAVALAAALFAVWYWLYATFALRGLLAATADPNPLLPIAMAIPLTIGLILIFRLDVVRRLLIVTPLHWLIGVQATRVVGIAFLVEWAVGNLPGEFALPAGLGDMLVGLLALPVAAAVRTDRPWAPAVAIAWNLLGLADFVSAVATGVLSSPGPLQALAFDHPNRLGTEYPLVMIPVFLIPIYVFLHVLALRKLAMPAQRRRSAEPSPSAA